MTRFAESAQRIIDGNFGSLRKLLQIKRATDYDYGTQTPTYQIIEAQALKVKLDKSEFENQDVQQGDFALMITDPISINVDTDSGIYDGVEVDFVAVREFAGDAGVRIMARLK